ncbi:Eaa1 [Klebsiella pneumoniae]|uniref:DUF551 domain-containing protein n=1 Tax=Klebsiella pneumoniae TaxID=573 RepID=UPI001083DA84|nr:Eaa1 [Klebsiella pneumoniae]
MTSKLTREQLHERARENVKALKMASRQTAFESAREEILADLQLAELALAAMDSEPVAWLLSGGGTKNVVCFDSGNAYADPLREVTPLYRHAQPALVIPDEMTSEQAYEIGYYYGDPVDVFARGANWMRQHIIDSTLAAAPQLPGSDPATVPGKWIPVSERMPENDGAYLCWDNRYVTTYAFIFGAWQANQFIAKNITHWMPLPAGPQEVSDA